MHFSLVTVVVFELVSIFGVAKTLEFEGFVFDFIELVPLFSARVTALAGELGVFSRDDVELPLSPKHIY